MRYRGLTSPASPLLLKSRTPIVMNQCFQSNGRAGSFLDFLAVKSPFGITLASLWPTLPTWVIWTSGWHTRWHCGLCKIRWPLDRSLDIDLLWFVYHFLSSQASHCDRCSEEARASAAATVDKEIWLQQRFAHLLLGGKCRSTTWQHWRTVSFTTWQLMFSIQLCVDREHWRRWLQPRVDPKCQP